ncbi:YhbY family RNA-binding protein [Bilifractor sp. HCP3S3_D3]|uniref:YhbY family RNA-binding protein n=1 Tax=Bilifractor sp. HCP3S3_D3 TaxID=3438907 RepID=UPI002A856753|nr:YhbY family RNA-binding protein [Eubacterium sp.]MDY5112662.1 YhbY family RNA-binding protein [Bilifractor sp.]
MTSKQRAYLKGLAMNEDTILHIGKSGITPELTENVRLALAARELIKIGILQNCMDDPKEMAQMLAERTKSQIVQIIGKKIVLYKEGQGDDRKIVFPK